ncbi:aspartate aminotransferase family protein [Lachnoclostridium phytofermentans]|uniref:Acetylornithine aminotransferase n=1 Tax=Lachnoclostridium phytofermentans (strain ATCC 700394 / DSM 18823 / ISDg) TaxID=357809 RepID=A9KHN4_LACP7|nr:aspartate aminotransferase family protein [Lachnoclostridium phytofermentans]ABX42319.1 acetylornithine and succinylornithine aminotransferase [Lachnoclostridium phytofermentans ISDg]
MENIINQQEQVLMHTYNRYPVVLDHGEGVYLYDINGKKYLDFVSGIAVFALGYANGEYNNVLKEQLDKLIHTSNYFYSEPALAAAKKLVKATGMDRVFFTNSGTEAIEGAIKLARKYYYKKYGKADSEIIAMEHSFHGRSMGALSVTGTKKYRDAFEPLIGGAVFVPYNNINELKGRISDKTCAILIETVQGEGGIYPADPEYLKEVRQICDDKDIVLILDEIQCGMGRCGTMFAYEQYGITPDIVTTAKALGCGVPVGAFAAKESVANALEPGDHGTTYGGNPLATAAVSKVFDLFEQEQILSNVKVVGEYLQGKLLELKKDNNSIVTIRGKGMMLGLEFNIPVKDIIARALEKNLILISAGTKVIRFLPPLIIEKKHVDEMISIFKECIGMNGTNK